MTSREAVLDQVAGILVRNEIRYVTRDDGQAYLAIFGTAGVHIEVLERGEQPIVMVRAPLVQQLALSDETRAALLVRLNRVNADAYFPKVYLADDLVQAEYALPAADLQGSELVNAVLEVARLADSLDEELVREFGGKTFLTVWEERNPPEPPVET